MFDVMIVCTLLCSHMDIAISAFVFITTNPVLIQFIGIDFNNWKSSLTSWRCKILCDVPVYLVASAGGINARILYILMFYFMNTSKISSPCKMTHEGYPFCIDETMDKLLMIFIN